MTFSVTTSPTSVQLSLDSHPCRCGPACLRPSPLPSPGCWSWGCWCSPRHRRPPAPRPDDHASRTRPTASASRQRGLRAQLLPLHGLPGLPRGGHGQRRLRAGQRQDVLADVLRPQLHQLRGVPDGAQRAAERAAVVRWRQRDVLGHLDAARSPTAPRGSARSPGGRPTPGRPAPRGTSRTSSRSSPPTRSSSPRTAGAATSPGPWSPGAAATGRAASSTSTTSRSPTPRSRSSPASPRSARVLTATAGTLEARHRQGRLPVVRRRRRRSAGRRAPPSSSPAPGSDQRITVRTTASQLGYPTRAAVSAPTEPVLPGALRNTSAPVISGVAAGRLHPAPRHRRLGPASPTLDVQWYADGEPIDGATGTDSRPRPRPGLPRRSPRRSPRRRPGYDAGRAVTTAPTAPVAPGTFTIDHARRSLRGTAELGEVLTVDPGVFRPPTRTSSIEWLRNGVPRRDRDDVPGHQASTSAPGSRRGSR